MLGYKKVSHYLVDHTNKDLVLQRCIAVAYRNKNEEWEFNDKDLRKMQKLAEAFANSKYLWLEFGEGRACWVHYLITHTWFNLEREIDSFEKELKYASK